MFRRLPMLAALAACSLAGCNRQDTDALARIGQKLTSLAQSQGENLREKYHVTLSLTPGIRERVQQRLTGDKGLQDAKIEVVATGKEIELKGTLANEEQRRQAVALAENTVGVDKVIDSLKIAAASQ